MRVVITIVAEIPDSGPTHDNLTEYLKIIAQQLPDVTVEAVKLSEVSESFTS